MVRAGGSDELEAAADALGGLAQRDHPLGSLTTYRVGGPAALYIDVADADALEDTRAALEGRSLPILVLGKGSNLLVADGGFAGVALHLGAGFESVAMAEAGVVAAGGAVGLPVLARRSVELALTGLEWGVGVPGSVGGAVAMNAGGHGSDISACLEHYEWVDLVSARGGQGDVTTLAPGYRTTSVSATEVVVSASFALAPGDPDVGRAALSEIVRWRRANQPGGSNAGSVFMNPPGDSAGRLIDAAGLRGFRHGSAQVSEKHANFIQADDGGSADDVAALVDLVASRVFDHAGVALHREVRLVGFPT